NAFFVAEQKNFLELGQPFAADGENDLVDHLLAQHLPQARDRKYTVLRAQPDGLDLGRSLRQKSKQPDSVLRRAFQFGPQLASPFAQPHHHNEMRSAELAASQAHQASRRQPEQAQKDPAIDRNQSEKRTAQLQPERKLKHHQGDGSVGALPEGVAQDDPRGARVQPVVNPEPQADQQPGEHGKAQQQRPCVEFQKKLALKLQPRPRFISGPEAQSRQSNV